MFSNSVVLIASHKQGAGDSGSRHAMNKAKEYNRKRFCMFNEKTDKNNTLFGLNIEEITRGAEIISSSKIKGLKDKISN